VSKKPEMTRKAALAVLHQFSDAVSWQWFLPEVSPERKALKDEVQTALRTLDTVVHGTRASCYGFGFGLCQICYLRYSASTVRLKGDPSGYAHACCTSCLRMLDDEGRLRHIEQVLTGVSSGVLVPPVTLRSRRKAVYSCSH